MDAIFASSSIEEILIDCRRSYDHPYSLTASPRIAQDSKIKRMLYRNSDVDEKALQRGGWPGDNPVKMRMQRVAYPEDPWLEGPVGKTSSTCIMHSLLLVSDRETLPLTDARCSCD